MPTKHRPVKGFTALRSALLDKTGNTRQWLSEQAKRTQILDVKVAQAVVAQRNGVRVSKYLDGSDLERVQRAIERSAGPEKASSTSARTSVHRGPSRGAAPSPRIIKFKGARIDTSDLLLPPGKLIEAQDMADVYPMLYLLENSMREVIHRIMAAQFGPNWWDNELTGKLRGIRERVASRLQAEEKNSWHQRRGARHVDYTDFDDLLGIAQSKPDLFFPRLLGEIDWFRHFFKGLVPSRNVVCHMNPLNSTNATDVAIRLKQWEEHIKVRRVELDAAMIPPVHAPKLAT